MLPGMPLKARTRLGPYEIVSPIGAGGMGEVYRARDRRLSRDVALKLLPEWAAEDEARHIRFAQEARIIAALNHPNVMAIHDVGQCDGIHYIITELLEGRTLREELATGALPAKKAGSYAVQIARGLEAAHEKGIVHRDLKPENLFVMKDGRIKILDFGVAKQVAASQEGGSQETSATQVPDTAKSLLGTGGYMAPEQVRGEIVDRRADIFAFGTVLYEMLAGRRAFSRNHPVETILSVLNEEPMELPERLGDPSATALSLIVRRCLKKDREQRFQSARDLEFALEAIEEAAKSSESKQRKARTMPRWAWLVAVLLVGSAIAGGGIWFSGRVRDTTPVRYRRLTFRNGVVTRARYGPDGDTVVFDAAWEGPAATIYTARADGSDVRTLNTGGDFNLLAVSRSGEVALATNGQHQTLAQIPVTGGGAARELLDHVYDADWFPDGRNLAVVRRENGQSRLEAPVGKTLYVTNGIITNMRVSPQGDAIAFMDHPARDDDRGSVAIVDLKGRKRDLTEEWGGESGLAWSPDGQEIWFSRAENYDWDRGLFAVSRTGRQRTILRIPGAFYLEDINRNGQVLFRLADRKLEVVAGDTSGHSRLLSWLQMMEAGSISRDGKFTVITDFSSDYSIYLAPTDGSPAVLLGSGTAGDISPDNRWVAAILPGDPSRVQLLPTGVGEIRTVTALKFQYSAAVFASDGRRLIVRASDAQHPERFWTQGLSPGSTPQPITPEGVPGVVVRVNRSDYVYERDAEGRPVLFPVDGGKPQPIHGIQADEEVIGGLNESTDTLYAVTDASPISQQIVKVHFRNGQRQPFTTISALNPAGIGSTGSPFFSGDGKRYVFSQVRGLTILYTATGLK
jgi:eukaryotic-like serine/threonine-protein kinase